MFLQVTEIPNPETGGNDYYYTFPDGVAFCILFSLIWLWTYIFYKFFKD